MSTMVSDGSDDPIGLLLLASVFKDDFPPFYEMALETYRTIKVGDMPSGEAIARLMRFAEIMAHSPFRDDISMNSKELHMMMMDLPEFISRIGRRLLVKKPATKVIRGLRKDLIK